MIEFTRVCHIYTKQKEALILKPFKKINIVSLGGNKMHT